MIFLQEKGIEYGGRSLKQNSDFSFQVSMSRYLRDKAQEIHLAKGRGKTPMADATPTEITQMRGVVGKISWASREGMPQGAGDASILSANLPNPKIADLTEANAALRRLLQNDVPIRTQPVPLEHLGLLSFSDASLGNTKGGSAQIGHLICATHKKNH